MNKLMIFTFLLLSATASVLSMDEEEIKKFLASEHAQSYIRKKLALCARNIPFTTDLHTQKVKRSSWTILYENQTSFKWSGKRKTKKVKKLLDLIIRDRLLQKESKKNNSEAYLVESSSVFKRFETIFEDARGNEDSIVASNSYAQDYRKYGDVEIIEEILCRRRKMIGLMLSSIIFSETSKKLLKKDH